MKRLFESMWTAPIAAIFLILASVAITYWLSNLPPWPYVSGGSVPGEMAFISSEHREQIEQTVSDLSKVALTDDLQQRVGEIPMQLFNLSQEILQADREFTIESVDPEGPFYWGYLTEPKVALTILGMLGSAIVFLAGLYFSATKKRRDDALHLLEIEKLRLEVANLKQAE